jgi:hypothetical protein
MEELYKEIKSLKYETIDEVIVSEEEDYRLVEFKIIYNCDKMLVLNDEEYVIVCPDKGIIEGHLFNILDMGILITINYEVVRAIHEITTNVFKKRTDCKASTLKIFIQMLDENYTEEESWYTKRLLLSAFDIHEAINFLGAEVAPLSIPLEAKKKRF